MAIFGTLATARSQTAPPFAFAAAFDYVADVLREGSSAGVRIRGIAAGETQRIELGKGVFALEQSYRSKPRAEGFFESHRKYVDIQVVVEGYESMEVGDVSAPTIRQPYHAERDLIIYEDLPEASALRIGAGIAAVFFPADVHMTGICSQAGPVVVRKTVVKVPVDSL